MRVHVIGDSECALALRGTLSRAGYATAQSFASYTIQIEEAATPRIVFDSIDCELERSILRRVRELSDTHIVIAVGSVRSDQAIRIIVPAESGPRRAVELGVFRGLEEMRGVKKPWYRRLL